MMTIRGDKQSFRNEDLVLKVSTDIDPKVWDESRYEAFLDELCDSREYQKSAIQAALRYIAGGRYSSLRDLAKRNFGENEQLQQRYGSWANMEKHLQLPDQLSCSLDLATATGKSYVLYGIAAILLAEGIVDRVLVLCPSNTIESGLLEKFKILAGSADLRDLLPNDAKVAVPNVINASETIIEGSICVENYHAILEHVKSSIRDSLRGKGQRVAVLNDEAHHVANETGTNARRWKEFLLNPDYGFRIVVGVSGTCYVGDEYFVDVISRYSLRQAMEERFVKRVEYVAEMPESGNAEEKWQLVYNRHNHTKKKLQKRGIRPLTIVVTKNIAECKRVIEQFRSFIEEWEGISAKKAEEKVLPVTSAPEHQPNIGRLKTVDSPQSPVEWIFSVAMLSEGWDVKNVFQIVPHEERAFNSKLLIAQVLGRGLRRPEKWSGEDPIVTVFNHDAWSGRIKHLVNEILEIQRRLYSRIVKDSPYNFALHTLDYTREEETSEFSKKGEYRFLENGFVDLPSQIEVEDVSIEFERAVSGERTRFNTRIQHKTYTIAEVAEVMFQRLRSIDEETKDAEDPKDRTNYGAKFPLERCTQIVQESLKRVKIKSGRITEDNRQKFLAALGTLRRKSAKRVVYKLKAHALAIFSTTDRQSESCSAAELRHGSRTVFYGPASETTLVDEEIEFFKEVEDIDGDFVGARVFVPNSYDLKTPLNLVIADASNERKFIRFLCERGNAEKLDAWIKNSPQKFYWIEYAWKKGEHPKRGEFSPDFFIKIGETVFVVEIKDDAEISDPMEENQKKWEYATAHFALLNDWLAENGIRTRYQFNFLSPKSFNAYFQKLRDGELEGFKSELDSALARANEQ